MKHLLLALSVLAAPLFVAQSADACAMKRRPPKIKMVVAKADFEKAQQAEQKGEFKTAIRLYERVMHGARDKAQRAEGAMSAARLHAKAGKQSRAVARARMATRLAPKSAAARLLMGELLLGAEDARALTQLHMAGVLGVSDADAARLAVARTKAHVALGQPDAARAQIDAAKALGLDGKVIADLEALLGGTLKVAAKS